MITSDLTPQQRAAKITWLLVRHGELTSREIMRETGVSNVAIQRIMRNLKAGGVPFYKPVPGRWVLQDAEDASDD